MCIRDRPCWNVQQGVGSFITLEFGQPILKIGKIYKRKGKPKRQVYVHGEWHLWIYCCNWEYFQDSELIAHNESSKREMKQATNDLNGQSLSQIAFDGQSTIFEFDLGGRLEIYPSNEYGNENIEQWYLFLQREHVITFHANGKLTKKSSTN